MNQTLLNQFFDLLEASSSFKLLHAEQQSAIKATYQNATDEQLAEGIKTLQKDKVVTEKIAANKQERLEKQYLQLKNKLRKFKKDDLIQEESEDNVASQKEAQELLHAL